VWLHNIETTSHPFCGWGCLIDSKLGHHLPLLPLLPLPKLELRFGLGFAFGRFLGDVAAAAAAAVLGVATRVTVRPWLRLWPLLR